MPEEKRVNYCFGEFTVDPHRRIMLRAGAAVPLASKAFDLLLALLESEDHELSKDELMSRIWADQMVEDANLTVTMAQLRKVLGEKASDRRFIVTIPGHGYRFVGELRREAPSMDGQTSNDNAPLLPPSATTPPAGSRAQVRGFRRPGLTLVVCLALMLAMAITAYYFWGRRTRATAAPAIKSIAVLPFKPLVADSRDESLEMGMADTLITRLSSNREIRVRPISAVRNYTALAQDPIAAGREQQVDAVLDGQIQKAGTKIRVTVRLLRVGDGAQMWASLFDEEMTDIFTVQDSISERVTSALAVTLTSEEQRGLTKRHTADAEAYQLYLKGRYQLNRLTDEGFFKGRDFFQQATEKDPNYALAYAGLADAYNSLGGFDALASKESFPKARDAAEQALRLDGELAEAHQALAVVKFSYDWDFAGAERECRRALEINPNYSDAHSTYGYFLTAMGRFDEALGEMQRAQELEPLSVEKIAAIGELLYYQRRYDQAIVQYRKALEMDSNSGFVHWALGRTFTAQARYNEAIEELKKAIPLSGDSPDEPAELARTYALMARRGEALKIVDELKRRTDRKVAPCVMAGIFSALGDEAQAFALLDHAFDERDFILVMLKVDPMFDPLRSQPRFGDLTRRVGLP
ncbi:MAG TPA: tetratricopeptide repeat protein [Pyrinomonadaceae bacterium]|nr:tetratricopeptide repeat protein [Pyrinomonadaceae bacterium]